MSYSEALEVGTSTCGFREVRGVELVLEIQFYL